MARLNLRTLLGRARQVALVPVIEAANTMKAAGAELLAAQRTASTAEDAFQAGLLDPDADIGVLDAARRSAGLKLDQARALVAALGDQHHAAVIAERQAAVAAVVAKAEETALRYRSAVEHDVADMAAKARALVMLSDDAERDRRAAIDALRAAGDVGELPAIEGFRGTAGRPAKILKTETVELWCDELGRAVGYQDRIVPLGDGAGMLKLPGATHSQTFTHRRRFERVEVLAEELPRYPVPLAGALTKIAAALSGLVMPAEPEIDTRQPETRLRPVGDMADVRQIPAQRRTA
jgi:hypothetical protein